MPIATPSTGVGLLAIGALLLTVTAAQAATPEQTCKSGKNKTAGKYAACRTNAEAKLAKGGDPSKYTEALDKCETKFSAAWQKLEEKATAAGASCPGGDTQIKGTTDTYADTVASLISGAGSRFVDKGDGTVIDRQTGLQWEKKTTALGSGENYADPHDVDNRYTWSATGTAPDGTAFTDFLTKLNAPPCFAGHCDWRLPSEEGLNVPNGLKELETILLEPYPCATNPCIDPIFGPTAAGYHWSATTDRFFPAYAWHVLFFNGFVSSTGKGDDLYVRAVRPGS